MMLSYLTHRMLCRDHFLPPVIICDKKEIDCVSRYVIRPHHPLFTPPIHSATPTFLFKIESVRRMHYVREVHQGGS
jgi:hypothetical protein